MVDEVMPDQPTLPRRRWPFTRRQIMSQVGVAAVILISGVAIGIGGTILSLKERNWRPPLPPVRDPNTLIDRWRTDLDLSDEQARQIKDAYAKRSAGLRIRMEEMRKSEQAERTAFDKSMKSILTDEQYIKWQEMLREHMKRLRERWPGGPDGRRGRGGPDGYRGRGGPDGYRGRGGPDEGRPGGPRGEWRPGGPPRPPRERHAEFRQPDLPQDVEPNAPVPSEDPNSGAST